MEFRTAQPHGDIKQIFKNVFMVTGTNFIHHDGVDIQTSRNMTIVRENGELTLMNTVRLNEEGLKALQALGQVKNVVRIGAFHGYDDPFYIDRYQAAFWATKGMKHQHTYKTDYELDEQSLKPLSNCQIVNFETTVFPESIVLISTEEGGLLITCDSIQNWTGMDPFMSESTFLMLQQQGLIKMANIPDTWLGACKPKLEELMTIKTLNFKHLLSAHGEPLKHIAHEKVTETLDHLIKNH